MKAAIYVRKSNDDSDRSDDNRSTTRQIERARAYAEAKHWQVSDDHIFVDDGISGAEFKERAGLIKLMAHLKEFDVIVMSEISRLGRDMVRNAVVIDDITAAGVRIFYYLTDREEVADTPEQRLMVTLNSFAAEMERAKCAERTRDALSRKAEKGYSTGGRCYGYNAVRIDGSHTDWAINEGEATVVRQIYKMYADGHGHAVIAKTLNGDPRYRELNDQYFDGQTPPPPASRRSSGHWPSSSIRAMLHRKRYAGVLEYGQTKKVCSGGSAKKRARGTKVLTIERPDLRIIEPHLWRRVQDRLAAARANYIRENGGDLGGCPTSGQPAKYLLSGLGECAVCGGNMAVVGGQRHRHYYYGCFRHQNRGLTACINNHREKLSVMDEAVVGAIQQSVLTPEAVDLIVEEAARLVEAKQKETPTYYKKLERELRDIQIELTRFMTLIATGKAPERVLVEIHAREDRIKELENELTAYQTRTVTELDQRRLRKVLRERAGRFNDLMHSDVPKARQALNKLLDGRIVFTPMVSNGRKSYKFAGRTKVGTLLYMHGTEERT